MKERDNIHKKIEQARIALGLSQREMAEKLGVGRTTYLNYETGKTSLFSKTHLLMSGFLTIPPEEMLSDDKKEENLLKDYDDQARILREALQEKDEKLRECEENLLSATRTIKALNEEIEEQKGTIRSLNKTNEYLLTQLSKK
ncbi:MAG: helix-turn-helix transcriptional regulator [Bacteroidales bacterium]|nr:helix-turn-helix transcriptional regulator [Bacteroidales bacterium]MDD6772975.1 helix-turn-helix transcriptional regulator [Bacteroidales bacterium]